MQNQLFEKLPKLFNIFKKASNITNSVYRSILSYVGKYPILATSVYLILIGNISFWNSYIKLNTGSVWNVSLFAISFFILIATIISIIFSIVRIKYLLKPVLIFILIASSFASYFMDNYGVMFDTTMIYNLFETDVNEATDLIGVGLMFHVLLTGMLPALIVYNSDLKFSSPFKQIFNNVVLFVVLVGVLVANILLFSSSYTSFFRNNHHVRYLINPVNYVYSVSKYISQTIMIHDKTPIRIGLDAKQIKYAGKDSRRSVVVLVVGETARAQNFSLNGYKKITTPLLGKNNEILNYPNVSSCGTSTHVSLPCMFSKFNREEFDEVQAKRYEKLPDVLQHAGLDVSWIDNNSGCKGVCKNIATKSTSSLHLDVVCNDSECFDEVMLLGLKEIIENKTKDAVIILHQKGNHGPAYYLRHPKKFTKFIPECTSKELNNCSIEEITNAYDNTILYTDYFLDKLITILKDQSDKIDTAMIYVSDHGESLGEHNIYLHSLPYMIAPKEQTHVPLISWFSNGFKQSRQFNSQCLKETTDMSISHDNLFHIVLGLTGVSTSLYNPALDIYKSCVTAK